VWTIHTASHESCLFASYLACFKPIYSLLGPLDLRCKRRRYSRYWADIDFWLVGLNIAKPCTHTGTERKRERERETGRHCRYCMLGSRKSGEFVQILSRSHPNPITRNIQPNTHIEHDASGSVLKRTRIHSHDLIQINEFNWYVDEQHRTQRKQNGVGYVTFLANSLIDIRSYFSQ